MRASRYEFKCGCGYDKVKVVVGLRSSLANEKDLSTPGTHGEIRYMSHWSALTWSRVQQIARGRRQVTMRNEQGSSPD